MARLTPKGVEDAKPRRSGRLELPDDGARGLYLVVQPSGAKSWAVRYRHEGKPKKYTLGSYPKVSLSIARAAAAAAMHQVGIGIDPAAEKKARLAPAKPDFVSVSAAFKDYNKKKLVSLRSGKQYEREIRRHFVAMYGERDIASITRKDVKDMRDDIVEDDHIPSANRTAAYVSAFLTWCVDQELIETNPALRLKKLPGEESRERVLSDDELRKLIRACGEVGGPWGDFAMTLLLTGQRLREISMLTTNEVNGDMLTLSKDRTKNGRTHDVPLSPAVVKILGRRPCVPIARKNFAYYFSTTHTVPISGFSKGRAAIQSKMEGVEHWTYHDLRRTLATRLEGLKVPLQVTEAILNHTSGSKAGVAGIYQRHKYAEEKREALDRWSEELERIARAS